MFLSVWYIAQFWWKWVSVMLVRAHIPNVMFLSSTALLSSHEIMHPLTVLPERIPSICDSENIFNVGILVFSTISALHLQQPQTEIFQFGPRMQISNRIWNQTAHICPLWIQLSHRVVSSTREWACTCLCICPLHTPHLFISFHKY